MKLFFRMLLAVIFMALANVSGVFSQTNIYYHYDASGNRIDRIVLHSLKSKTQIADSTMSKADSLQLEKEVFKEKLGEQNISIHPNPTHGQLIIEISGYDKVSPTGIYLYNLNGILLGTKTPVNASNIVDLSSFPGATYLLKIVLGKKVSEWKVVKE